MAEITPIALRTLTTLRVGAAPARMIETNTVFLPSITGARMRASGVSMSIICVGIARVTS